MLFFVFNQILFEFLAYQLLTQQQVMLVLPDIVLRICFKIFVDLLSNKLYKFICKLILLLLKQKQKIYRSSFLITCYRRASGKFFRTGSTGLNLQSSYPNKCFLCQFGIIVISMTTLTLFPSYYSRGSKFGKILMKGVHYLSNLSKQILSTPPRH